MIFSFLAATFAMSVFCLFFVCSTKIGEIPDISECFENFVSQALGVLTRIYAAELRDTFNTFRRFVKTHFKASVENLFKNDKLDEKDKIEQINKWWNEFKKETNNKK